MCARRQLRLHSFGSRAIAKHLRPEEGRQHGWPGWTSLEHTADGAGGEVRKYISGSPQIAVDRAARDFLSLFEEQRGMRLFYLFELVYSAVQIRTNWAFDPREDFENLTGAVGSPGQAHGM